MLNLVSKASPSSQVFGIPSNFGSHHLGTEAGHLLHLHVIVFVKNDRIAISVSVILSINQ